MFQGSGSGFSGYSGDGRINWKLLHAEDYHNLRASGFEGVGAYLDFESRLNSRREPIQAASRLILSVVQVWITLKPKPYLDAPM